MRIASFGFGLVLMLSNAIPTAASVSNDQVQSQHIREADGTSGQNTNSGAGVKTGHIQDSAVTTPKIADGAVTDAKIFGTISSAKLPVGTTAGTVAAGDHLHDTLYQKKYANVIVVALSGGDYTDPIAAVGSITDASETNPYLVKIMPGVYNIGITSLQMKQFVDVEGSGRGVTKIQGALGLGTVMGLVQGANNCEIRALTIHNEAAGYRVTGISNSQCSMSVADIAIVVRKTDGGGGFAQGIYNPGNGHVKARNVSIQASTPGWAALGVYNQMGSSADLEDVQIDLTEAVYILGVGAGDTSTANLNRVTLNCDGVDPDSSCLAGATATSIQVANSTISSLNWAATWPVNFSYSRILSGTVAAGSKCAFCVDVNLDPLDSLCQ